MPITMLGGRGTAVDSRKPYSTPVLLYRVGMTQLKFVVDDELAKEFKQLVLAKRGKLELSSEGEAALKLYIEKHKGADSRKASRRADPLTRVVGAIESGQRRDALTDLRRLETEN